MRDIAVVYPENAEDAGWDIDIDIIDGYPKYVAQADNTQDQRAALAALMVRGTIPGARDIGVSWGKLLDGEGSLLTIDNEVRRQIASLAAIGNDQQVTQYLPVYMQNKKGGVDVNVYRAL